MKRKAIKIDWEALDAAFSRPHEDVESYLDLVSGQLVLDGEGDDEGDDQDAYAPGAVAGPEAQTDDATRIWVHPPDTPTKIGWLEEFIQQNPVDNDELLSELTAAMEADDPAGAIGAVLNQNPDLRDSWYVYRADRIHEWIERWLAEQQVAPVDPPPWA